MAKKEVRSDSFFVCSELSSGPLERERGKEVSEDLCGGGVVRSSRAGEGSPGQDDEVEEECMAPLREGGGLDILQQVRQKGSLIGEGQQLLSGRRLWADEAADGVVAAGRQGTAHRGAFAHLSKKFGPFGVTVHLVVRPHQTVLCDTLKGIWQVVEASRVIPGLLGSGGGEGRHDGLVSDAGEQDPVRVLGARLGEGELDSRGGEEEVLAAGQERGVEEDDLRGIAAFVAPEGLLQVEFQVRDVPQPALTEEVVGQTRAIELLENAGQSLLESKHCGSSWERKQEENHPFFFFFFFFFSIPLH